MLGAYSTKETMLTRNFKISGAVSNDNKHFFTVDTLETVTELFGESTGLFLLPIRPHNCVHYVNDSIFWLTKMICL